MICVFLQKNPWIHLNATYSLKKKNSIHSYRSVLVSVSFFLHSFCSFIDDGNGKQEHTFRWTHAFYLIYNLRKLNIKENDFVFLTHSAIATIAPTEQNWCFLWMHNNGVHSIYLDTCIHTQHIIAVIIVGDFFFHTLIEWIDYDGSTHTHTHTRKGWCSRLQKSMFSF